MAFNLERLVKVHTTRRNKRVQEQIQQFLEYIVDQKSGSSNTTAAYRNDLQQLLGHLQQQKTQSQDQAASEKIAQWAAITPDIMDGYLNMLRDEKLYAPATIARKVASVKSFFQHLTVEQLIQSDPSHHLEPPKVQKNRPRLITAGEIKKLLAAPAKVGTLKATRDKALLEVLYSTGVRVTELVNLNLSHVNIKKREIHCTGNESRNRILALSKSAATALDLYIRGDRKNSASDENEVALFLNHRGQRLTRQGLWLIIKRYVKTVGITGNVTPHTLRHSFANHQLSSGVGLIELQKRLGHASISTTLIYQQMADDEKDTEMGGKELANGELVGAEEVGTEEVSNG